MILIKNEFFQLKVENESVYISVLAPGFLLTDFNKVIESYPRISLTSFLDLKKALEEAKNEDTLIGQYLPLVVCTVSKDKMSASIKINATDDEFQQLKKELPSKVVQALAEEGVTEGLLMEIIAEQLVPRKNIVVAQGMEPIHGSDAVIRYYQLSERKPTISETGKADFYDMNFIDEVEKGTWVGEKIAPTEGVPGMNVLGEELKARKGSDKRLIYDTNSISEQEEKGKIVLRAKMKGAVTKKDGKLSIANHLIIDGDVGIGTGNIEFDGSVTINGTVQEGFSVIAGMDVSILSEMGIRQVGTIESLQGDIFIKGGVFGEGVIKAAKNIYVKHANECALHAGGDIHIGFYSIGSTLVGRNVITEQAKGKIIGGHIVAQGKVFASEIGNKAERKTFIQVEGFERDKIQEQLNHLLKTYKQVLQEFEEVHRHIEIFESFAENLNATQQAKFDELKATYDVKFKQISKLEEQRKVLAAMLSIKGDGEISIEQKAYPETYIEIKNMKKKLDCLSKGTFYAMGKELKYE